MFHDPVDDVLDDQINWCLYIDRHYDLFGQWSLQLWWINHLNSDTRVLYDSTTTIRDVSARNASIPRVPSLIMATQPSCILLYNNNNSQWHSKCQHYWLVVVEWCRPWSIQAYRFSWIAVADWQTQTPTCNARGDRFAPQRRRHFGDSFLKSKQFPAQRDLKWSVWHCRKFDVRGQNRRLSPDNRFQDRYNTNAIIVIFFITVWTITFITVSIIRRSYTRH